MFNNCCRPPVACRSYAFPLPGPKQPKHLDTIRLEEFEVKAVGESCIEKCCQPCPVGIEVTKSVFILNEVTNCIEPDTYYFLDVNRKEPIDYGALQVFVRAEPCGFKRGPVDLQKKTVVIPYEGDDFKITAENLPNLYSAFLKQNGCEESGCGHNHGGGCGGKLDFIEVDKAPRGNISVGADFFGHNHCGINVRQHDYNARNQYVLYYNNAGRFELMPYEHFCACWKQRYGRTYGW